MTWYDVKNVEPKYNKQNLKSEELEIMLIDGTIITAYYSPWCGWCQISSFYQEYMIQTETILKWRYKNDSIN